MKMIYPTLDEEKKLWNKGYNYVIGIDEVGRGAFAGPIVAAGVVFKSSSCHSELVSESLLINDSKRLSHQQRVKAAEWIKKNCLTFSISQIEVPFINKYGIGKANLAVFHKVINNLLSNNKTIKQFNNTFLLVDGFHVRYVRGIGLKYQKAIVGGDGKSISIAAASILAKIYRDKLMEDLDKEYPNYNFGKHKGYGTKFHCQMIKKYGLSKIHRTSFDLRKFLLLDNKQKNV